MQKAGKEKKKERYKTNMPPPSPATAILEAGGELSEQFMWKDLIQKYETLHHAFTSHKASADKQIQDYIRKIFERTTEAALDKESKELMKQRALDMEAQCTAMQGENEQLEQMYAKQLSALGREREHEVFKINQEMKNLQKQVMHYQLLAQSQGIVDDLENMDNEGRQSDQEENDLDAIVDNDIIDDLDAIVDNDNIDNLDNLDSLDNLSGEDINLNADL